MSATRAQRIGIWVIAVFMAVGTIGSFAIIILANDNQKSDQSRLATLEADYKKSQAEYQAKVDAQAAVLSEKYFATFNQFVSRPAAFAKDSVTALKTEDIIVGDGEEITAESSFTAYYIGWNPDGTMFDSSFNADKTALKAPFTATPGGVIKGWSEGAVGMKIGGARELVIPSDLAYGEAGSGADIPANTPLKFVMMLIPTPEVIPQPEIPAALLRYYQTGRL